ncbi:hypothetical protein D9611_011898 [Ephemerocybe angulata]|uniref:P-loop containing nucleoside triphosphate hydrolase protein n=1 Tax=Ephemerocybe angulata TaxID=980116 RepID=A0A8H5BZS8_9AGAR|nr:hypothetical protein D9611_011898 [Tulosesus angulatus]
MDTLKSFMQPLMGGSSMVDGMKLVVLGGTVETARRVSSSAWSHFVNSHFCEEEQPYDWLVLWLSRRPEWQRSREFEATLRAFSTASTASSTKSPADLEWEEAEREWESYNSSAPTHHDGTPREPPLHIPGADDDVPLPEKPKSRIIFQPTYDTTHTIFFRGHWLRVKRQRKLDTGSEAISISVIARSNAILKQLVLQAKKEYEAECIHRIQIYFADAHGSWRWTDSRAKRPLGSIVLNPGVKEMLVEDTKDFLRSEKWYMDRGIPFRRGYLLYGVPGSGKSSLIHALAGYLQLDIYVVSLSASWISDSTLTSLMGRVPARCVVLLEDLDAAFTRSTSREDEEEALLNSLNSTSTSNNNKSNSSNNNNGNDDSSGGFGSAFGYSSRRRNGHRSSGRNSGGDYLSDVNTLSLSGLLNALDGVAAAEGRLLFATTNHLEKLDPALSRPGRMDVWIEFKNASRWQAEALFRNFFPCDEGDEEEENAAKESQEVIERREREVDEAMKSIKVEMASSAPSPADSRRGSRVFTPSSSVPQTPGAETTASSGSLWSLASSATSLLGGSSPSSSQGVLSGLSGLSSGSSTTSNSPLLMNPVSLPSFSMPSIDPNGPNSPPLSPLNPQRHDPISINTQNSSSASTKDSFGSSNTAYPRPPPDADVREKLARHSAAPLDRKTLAELAKTFADGVPEEEFSVASLQGYLLKHKSNPHLAASTIHDWVSSERTLRATMAKEKAAREEKAKAAKEKRLAELKEKKKEKEEKEGKEKEVEELKRKLKEKEEEEEVERMREKLREKEKEAEAGKKTEEGATTKEEAKEGDKKKEVDEEDEDKENWSDARDALS